MPKFTYSAKKGPQEKVFGIVDAKGRSQVAAIIEGKGLFPISIEEVSDEKSAGMGVFSVKRVRLKDLTIFTRQFSNLIESGLTIAQALNIIIKQAGNPVLKNILFDIGERIKDGSTFSDALSAHSGQFSQYYCAVVKAGEISGSLETVLTRLADFSEQEERTRSDILSALTYPALIVGVGFVTIYALLVYAVPQLTSMFEEAGEALPLPTQLLINLSSVLRNYWWLLLLFSGAVFFIIKQEKSQSEKYFWDKLLLGIPLAGKIILKSEMAHFARILSLLMESGVSIMVALDVVNNTIVNNVIKSEIKGIASQIKDGASLSQSAKKSVYFPEYVVSIINVGEEAGTLEKSLKRIAVSYEEELGRLTRALTSLLEPVIILVMGLVVGFIVTAMLLPIFQINLITR
ncbi:MAG: type II secretion system F family protein [Candidatus Omnitrophota bacterium]